MKLTPRSSNPSGFSARNRRLALPGVAVIAMLVLGGCSTGAAGEGGSNGASDIENFEQYIGNPDPAICGGREYTFGYNTFSDTEEFAVNLWDGIQRVANELGCVTVTKLSDNIDPALAVQNAQTFVQQGVDGALLFNVLEAAGPGQVQVLRQAGIPAVTIVVQAEGETFVTNDDLNDGLSAGRELGKAYLDRGLDGPVHAIIGLFDNQGATGIARMDGARQGLEETVPGLVVHEFETNADPTAAQSGAAAILATIPADATILITGINDGIANAILQAAKQASASDRTMVAAIGAVNPGGLQFMCQNPEYVGAQGFFPERWAEYMIPALIARVQGISIADKYVVPTEFIRADAISDFYPDFKCNK